jgi:hypothetical protein
LEAVPAHQDRHRFGMHEIGDGPFFDLVDGSANAASTNLSPKPEAMALAAMTRIIDATQAAAALAIA